MSRPQMSMCRRLRRGILDLVAVALLASAGFALAAQKPEGKKPVPVPVPAAKAPLGQRPPAVVDLYEGPSTPKPAKPPVAKPAQENKFEAPLSPGPKYADAWPSEI